MKESRESIRSYVRREHRITPGQSRALQRWWGEYGLSIEESGAAIKGECILEIGFGMGRSLLVQAAKYPEKNFIGIEVHKPGIGALLLVAAEQRLTNIKIFNEDAVNVLKQAIKDDSLSEIQIYFPDPWPKKRHRKRRLIQTGFAELLCRKLKPGGRLHLATDWEDYAEQMLTIMENIPQLTNLSGPGNYSSHKNDRPITKFEQRSLDAGGPVWDLLFVK